MAEHETYVNVGTRYHPSGDEYTWATAWCETCDWEWQGDESDARDEAAGHERLHAPPTREECLAEQCDRLAHGLTMLATLGPGGTRWPHWSLPDEHAVYAFVGFRGGNVIGGGADAEEARTALYGALIQRASQPR